MTRRNDLDLAGGGSTAGIFLIGKRKPDPYFLNVGIWIRLLHKNGKQRVDGAE